MRKFAQIECISTSTPATKGVQETQNSTAKVPSLSSRQIVIQPQLELTQSGDSYEREADCMADFVMSKAFSSRGDLSLEYPSRISALPSIISRRVDSSSGVAVDAFIEDGINASQGSGHPLPEMLRSKMETAFDSDFSRVRLHTDSRAAELSSGISAKAFTYSNDIYFNRGQYQPYSTEGLHLLAHELTHVVQQNGRVAREPYGGPTVEPAPISQRGEVADEEGIVWGMIAELAKQAKNIIIDLRPTYMLFKDARKTFYSSYFKELENLIDALELVGKREMNLSKIAIVDTFVNSAKSASRLSKRIGLYSILFAFRHFLVAIKEFDREFFASSCAIVFVKVMDLISAIATYPPAILEITKIFPLNGAYVLTFGGAWTIGGVVGDGINFLSEIALDKPIGAIIVDEIMDADISKMTEKDVLKSPLLFEARLKYEVFNVQKSSMRVDKVIAFARHYIRSVTKGWPATFLTKSSAEDFLQWAFQESSISVDFNSFNRIELDCLQKAFVNIGLY